MGLGLHLEDEVPDNRGNDIERGSARADVGCIGGWNSKDGDRGRKAAEASCTASWQS
jgi:hypothetical protein